MSTGLVRRERCVVCGAGQLSPILTVPSFPVFQGCVPFDWSLDECAPMAWGACETCGSAQIVALPPLERVYQAGHATGLGQAWARHHAAFAAFLSEYARDPVVDVGGGSGTLASAYRNAGGTAAWTILEPNALKSPSLPRDVEIVDGFLDGASLKRVGASSVVMCHMFEHVVDLRATLLDITQALPAHGTVLLAWPELEIWVGNGLAGALNFEHGIYLTMPRLKALFNEFGWRLVSARHWSENHTIFMAFVRGPVGSKPIPARSAARAVAAYFKTFQTCAEAIGRRLDSHRGEAFLMPASVYAQALIAGGLDESRFTGLLDNAPIKQGARLYGTKLKVSAPGVGLAAARHPLVVLNGGAHDSEIAQGLRAIRPDIEVLSAQALERSARQVLQA